MRQKMFAPKGGFSIRYGLITILRTPLKTMMFLLLIMVMTVFLSLGFGMWQSAENMLNEADMTFTTVGEFMFTGGGYPDSLRYDEVLAASYAEFDLKNFNRKEVLFMEDNITQRASLHGFEQSDENMKYKQYSVLRVKIEKYDDSNRYADIDILDRIYYKLSETSPPVYVANITDIIYSNLPIDGETIFLYEEPNMFQVGHEYIIFATSHTVDEQAAELGVTVYPGYKVNSPGVFEFAENASDYAMVADVTDYKTTEYFQMLINSLRIVNNAIDIVASKNTETVGVFNSGKYTLTEGRFLSEGDVDLCLIPQNMADQLGLSLGDTVTIDIHHPTGKMGRYSSYWEGIGFATENQQYTIAGIYQANEASLPIYIPNNGQTWLKHSDNDYKLARMVLDNRRAENYAKKIEQNLPAGVTFTMNDQGYEAAVMPIKSLRETSALIITLCGVACILVLWFFGYMFIYRNEHNGKVLLALGAGAKHVMLYFLSGGGFIVVLGAAIGSVLSFFISKNVFDRMFDSAQASIVHDFRFSVVSYGIKSERYVVRPEVNFAVYVAIALIVIIISLAFCSFFAYNIIQNQNPHYKYKERMNVKVKHSAKEIEKKTEKPTEPMHTKGEDFAMMLPTVALSYAVKSVFRGGKRSFVVPVLFTTLLLFICIFYNLRADFQERLDKASFDVPVIMRFCDITGKEIDDLTISPSEVLEVYDSGFVYEIYPTIKSSAEVLGIVKYADGTYPDEKAKAFVPQKTKEEREEFIEDWKSTSFPIVRFNTVPKESLLGATSAFKAIPEFAYYSETPKITWADNYSEDLFIDSSDNTYFRPEWLFSEALLEKYNVSVGDTVSLLIMFSERDDYEEAYAMEHYSAASMQLEIVVAGSCATELREPVIYWPTSNFIGIEDIKAYSDGGGWPISSVAFRLKDTQNISEFKDWLEERFDPLGSYGEHGRWVIMNDAPLYSTIDSYTRYIGYLNMFYPIILAMVIGIGFLVSHLLLKGRNGEIAILRGIGASKVTVFFAYFNEQFLLSLVGIALGLGFAMLILGGIGKINPFNVLLLSVCYYAGLTLAIANIYQKAAIKAIKAKEE